MKTLLAGSFALFIVLAFMCGLAVSVEKPNDKAVQPPAKIDKAKTEQNKKKAESKDMKGKTEKNASQKSDKAIGEVGGIRPPSPPPVGPVGKSTSTNVDKVPAAASKQRHENSEKAINNMK